MRSTTMIVAAIAFIAAFPAGTLAVPDIDGSDPIHTETDYYAAGDWEMTVYSYVYDATSTSLPGALEIDPDEMLFMYLLDVPLTSGSAVHQFFVGNPSNLEINAVGHEQFTIPSGYNGANYEDPYVFGYSGTSQDTIWTYFGDWFDPFPNIDPGEYSLVWYIAVSSAYDSVPGTASSEGISDTQYVPGPVPEPTTICLLGLGALALLRKRRA